MLTKEEIIAFEKEIADVFATGVIRAPVHLRSGREDDLIKIFKDFNINDDDYVFGFWDSHELALLKGVPREELKQAIIEGKSISLCFPKQKVLQKIGQLAKTRGIRSLGFLIRRNPQTPIFLKGGLSGKIGKLEHTAQIAGQWYWGC